MGKKPTEVKFDRLISTVEFDPEKDSVSLTKTHFVVSDSGIFEPVHVDDVSFDLRTIPFSSAMQIISEMIRHIHLLDYGKE